MSTGDRSSSTQVPDYFHGRLRVMAIAVSPQLIGTVETATTVRGDFVLSPDIPTTLAPGDEADIGVGVSNNLTGAGHGRHAGAVAAEDRPQLPAPRRQRPELAAGVVQHEGRGDSSACGPPPRWARAIWPSPPLRRQSPPAQSVDISVRPASAYRTQIEIAPVAPGGNKAVLDTAPHV